MKKLSMTSVIYDILKNTTENQSKICKNNAFVLQVQKVD